MLSGTLALMTRALRLDARMLRSHLFRLLFVVIILMSLVAARLYVTFLGAPGLAFFIQMAVLNAAFITLAGLSFFSTSITEEKEEETLGLLKMAGISSFAILIGKSAPRLIVALLLLSVQFPFTLLAVTLGGVTLHQVFSTYVSLLAYLFLVANLGLICSVVRRRSSAASGMCTLLLLGYLGVPFAQRVLQLIANVWFGINASAVNSAQAALQPIYETSITSRLFAIMKTGFDDPLLSGQVVSNVAVGCVLFLSAWAAFDFCTREQKPITERRTWAFRRSGLFGRLGVSRAWPKAVVWKDFHFAAGGVMVLLFKFLAYPAVIWLVTYLLYPRRLDLQRLGQIGMTVALVGLVIEASIFASRMFHTEVKWRTLPALMMLPNSTAYIAYSKVVGCLIGLAPAIVYFLIAAELSGGEFDQSVQRLFDEAWFWFMFLQFFLFLHLTAFLSLTIKWGAMPLSFGIVYITATCCIPTLTMTGVMRGGGEGVFAFLSFAELVLIAALHPLIGYRMQEMAAK